jgi:hypothetical protein
MKSTFYFSSAVILAALIASFASIPSAFASNDAYDSGRDHGCDDANISDPDDRYINQPERGPSYHTGAFMDGYHAGFDACSGNGDDNDNGGSNNNGDSDILGDICRQLKTNPGAALALATGLGYPSLAAIAPFLPC